MNNNGVLFINQESFFTSFKNFSISRNFQNKQKRENIKNEVEFQNIKNFQKDFSNRIFCQIKNQTQKIIKRKKFLKKVNKKIIYRSKNDFIPRLKSHFFFQRRK